MFTVSNVVLVVSFDRTSRVTETLADDWCGPTPRCPYRHWLRAAKDQATGFFVDKSVCTFSSRDQASYPWPWFNEFALEATLLRRWRADLFTCRTRAASPHSGDACAADADVVVVPSLYLHSTGNSHALRPGSLKPAEAPNPAISELRSILPVLRTSFVFAF